MFVGLFFVVLTCRGYFGRPKSGLLFKRMLTAFFLDDCLLLARACYILDFGLPICLRLLVADEEFERAIL